MVFGADVPGRCRTSPPNEALLPSAGGWGGGLLAVLACRNYYGPPQQSAAALGSRAANLERFDRAAIYRMVNAPLGRAASSGQPILGTEYPVARPARLAGRDREGVVGYCAARCAGPYVQTIKGFGDGVRVDLGQAAYIAP